MNLMPARLSRMAARMSLAACGMAFRTIYRIKARREKPNPGQCVFCSMDGDSFGGLMPVKRRLQQDGLPCFNLFGPLDTLAKARRAAKKLAGAEVAVLDAACEWVGTVPLKGRTAVVQTWHAAGAYKKFGRDSVDVAKPAELAKQKRLHGYYDWVAVSAESVAGVYAAAFGMPPERAVPLGTPRIDALLETDARRAEWKSWLAMQQEETAGRKLVLYAPTFREIKGKRDYSPTLNMAGLAEQLPDGIALGARLHPRAKLEDAIPDGWIDMSGVPQEVCLACADVLVTDYSSIAFDFAALGRPVLFYTPDEIAYARGLYFSPRVKYPRLAFDDWFGLADALARMCSCRQAWDEYASEALRIKEEYVGHAGHATDMVADFVKSLTSAGSGRAA